MGVGRSKDRAGGEIPREVAEKFTKDELDMLRKSFKDLAQRSPGKTIDKETFLKFFPLPGLHGQGLFEAFDHKQTGNLDLEEFIGGLAVAVRGTFDEKVKLVFRIYDIDNTQYVSKDELRTMLHQLPTSALLILSARFKDEDKKNPVAEALHDQLLNEQSLNSQKASSESRKGTPSSTTRKEIVAPNSKVAISLVNCLVEDAFDSFDLNKDSKLSPTQFREWVKHTPHVLDFLESVFPIHEKKPLSKDSSDAPLPPEKSRSPSKSGSVDRIHSIASSPSSKGRLRRSSSGSNPFSSGIVNALGLSKSSSSPQIKMIEQQGGQDIAEPDVRMSGILYKVGRLTKTCRGRFFLIRGQIMYYYYSNRLEKPAGVIFLQGCYVTPRGLAAEGTSPTKKSPTSPKSGASTSGIVSLFSEKALTAKKDGSNQGFHQKPLTTSFGASNKQFFPFEIITSQGGDRDSRILYAKTEEERTAWIDAIKEASNVIPFNQRFHMLEEIGRGKFAVVYKCEKITQLDDDHEDESEAQPETFAVKVIDKSSLDEDERDLLRTEIAILKLVNHPNIISMEDLSESLHHIYIVLEHIQGGELFDRIVGRARMKEHESYPVVKQLVEAVHYLHLLGVVHRDIKPENILCTGNMNDPVWESKLKICDFGLSKLVSPQEVMKLACGTLSYVAPEVLSSLGYGKEADIWNIGVILYLIRRGRLPFDGETKDEVIHNTMNRDLNLEQDPVFKSSSKEFLDLLAGLLAKNPKKRFTAIQILKHPWMEIMEKKWIMEFGGLPPALESCEYEKVSSLVSQISTANEITLLGETVDANEDSASFPLLHEPLEAKDKESTRNRVSSLEACESPGHANNDNNNNNSNKNQSMVRNRSATDPST